MAFGRLGSVGAGFGRLGARAHGGVSGPVGGAALLANETDGFATDFTYPVDAQRVAVKVAGIVTSYGLDAFYLNTNQQPKLVFDASGNLVWSPHNMFLNSAAPVTQSVTTIVGMTYTVTMVGSGSMTGSAGASGVATAGSPLTFAATTTTSTFTKAGTVTQIQMNRGSVATAYLASGAVPRAGLTVDYHPSTHAALGLLTEPAATNLLLNNAALSTQSVTVTAVAHTLSFFGTGTITLSGTSTAGPLTGTGASNRVSLTFTPTAGSLTLTVSGTVANAQLETGSAATSIIPTFGTTVTRSVDAVNVTPASINFSATVGSWWLETYQISNPGGARWISTLAGASIFQGATTTVTFADGTNLSKNIAVAVLGNTIKVAVAYLAGDRAITGQGLAPGTDAAALGASLTSPGAGIYIGGVGGNISNGYARKLTYRARRVSNAAMQTETA